MLAVLFPNTQQPLPEPNGPPGQDTCDAADTSLFAGLLSVLMLTNVAVEPTAEAAVLSASAPGLAAAVNTEDLPEFMDVSLPAGSELPPFEAPPALGTLPGLPSAPLPPESSAPSVEPATASVSAPAPSPLTIAPAALTQIAVSTTPEQPASLTIVNTGAALESLALATPVAMCAPPSTTVEADTGPAAVVAAVSTEAAAPPVKASDNKQAPPVATLELVLSPMVTASASEASRPVNDGSKPPIAALLPTSDGGGSMLHLGKRLPAKPVTQTLAVSPVVPEDIKGSQPVAPTLSANEHGGLASITPPPSGTEAKPPSGQSDVPKQPVFHVEAKNLVLDTVHHLRLTMRQDEHHMTLRLSPESLGEVHVDISGKQGEWVVRMTSNNPATANLFERNAEQLRHSLAQSGFEGVKVEVNSGMPSGAGDFANRHGPPQDLDSESPFAPVFRPQLHSEAFKPLHDYATSHEGNLNLFI